MLYKNLTRGKLKWLNYEACGIFSQTSRAICGISLPRQSTGETLFMKRVSLMTIKKSVCLGSFWSVQRVVLVHSLGTTHSGKSVIFKNCLKSPNLSEALRYGEANTSRHSNPTLFLHISTEHIAAFSATKFHSFQILQHSHPGIR